MRHDEPVDSKHIFHDLTKIFFFEENFGDLRNPKEDYNHPLSGFRIFHHFVEVLFRGFPLKNAPSL